MKKKTIVAASLLMVFSITAFAQEDCKESSCATYNNDTAALIKNKKGRYILPKKGDIALGFNAIPVFDFFLNSLNYVGSGKSNPNDAGSLVGYTSSGANFNNQITGKYFLNAHTAIRARLGYNTQSGSITNPVQNAVDMYQALQSGNPNDIQAASQEKVKDAYSFARSNITLSGGIEKRRGYGRLQGFYGAELGIGFMKSNSNVNYGNAFSSQYESQYTSSWSPSGVSTLNPNAVIINPATGGQSRNLDTTYNSLITVGLRAFIGVEYFIFPKISISAEFGWGYAISWKQDYSVTNETYFNGQNGPADVVQTTNGPSATTRGFQVDNNAAPLGTALGNPGLAGASGSIILFFYF